MGQWLLSTAEHLETIISIYADMVYRLAFARCGNKYDADEIFQEVFLRSVKKQPVFPVSYTHLDVYKRQQ